METIEVTSKRYVCRHIHTTGNRCGSPALRGEEFCYYHHATRRGPRPIDHDYLCPNSTFDLPSLEDRPSIQLAVAVVARRIALNQIDLQRGRLLLYALRIASNNLPREPHLDPEAIDQVDEMQHDPIHGPLAPVAEVPPQQEGSKGLLQRFMDEMRSRPCPHCNTERTQEPETAEPPTEEPAAIVLPEIQAVAEPLTTHHSQLTTAVKSRLNPFVPETLNKQFPNHRRQPSTLTRPRRHTPIQHRSPMARGPVNLLACLHPGDILVQRRTAQTGLLTRCTPSCKHQFRGNPS